MKEPSFWRAWLVAAGALSLFVACAAPSEPQAPPSSEPLGSEDGDGPPPPSTADGRSVDKPLAAAEDELTDEPSDFSRSVASLGSRLAPFLVEGDHQTGNLAFSPLGVHAVLSVLASGAGGTSRAGLEQLLGLVADETLQTEYRRHLEMLAGLPGVGLHFRLDCAEKLSPQDDWLAALSNDFQLTFAVQDFLNDARGSTSRIDAWFREQTNGRIPSLYGPNVLPKTISIVASSALTFRMDWARRFSALETAARPFHLRNGQTASVPTMRAENLPVLVGRLGASPAQDTVGAGVPGPLWVAIPFAGQTTFLLLGLPGSEGDLPELERQLGTVGAVAMLNDMDAGKHEILLPKIDWLTPTFSLGSQIQKLDGGRELSHLDLSRAGLGGPFVMSSLVQRVAARWDEQGADLAAATSIAGTGIGLSTVKPIAFDQPFVFAVVERATGLVLFQGRVSDPRNFGR